MRIENINPPNVALTLELTVPSDVVLPPVFSVELWNNDINHISVNYTGDNPVGTFIRTVHYHADGTPVYAYPEYTDLGTLGSRYRIPHRFYESMRENGYPCEQDLPRALNIAETWKTILDHVRTGNPTAPALSPKPLL